jgi:hypothetical protein
VAGKNEETVTEVREWVDAIGRMHHDATGELRDDHENGGLSENGEEERLPPSPVKKIVSFGED